jgi:hypothetical protein
MLMIKNTGSREHMLGILDQQEILGILGSRRSVKLKLSRASSSSVICVKIAHCESQSRCGAAYESEHKFHISSDSDSGSASGNADCPNV